MFNKSLFQLQEYRDEAYLAFVREWPCLVCKPEQQKKKTEAAHTGEHGLGIKAPDFSTVPLCEDHHRGPYGLDNLGPERFEQAYNIDLKKEVLWLIHAYLSQGNQLGKIVKERKTDG